MFKCFLVRWSIDLSPPFLQLRKSRPYLTIDTARVFISLIRILLFTFVSCIFFIYFIFLFFSFFPALDRCTSIPVNLSCSDIVFAHSYIIDLHLFLSSTVVKIFLLLLFKIRRRVKYKWKKRQKLSLKNHIFRIFNLLISANQTYFPVSNGVN